MRIEEQVQPKRARIALNDSEPRLPPDFAEWFREHRPTVYRYIRFRLATREAAEDVTSEVFMKALRAMDRYDPSRASPRTWLLRIARNAVTDHLRSLRRRSSLHVSLDRVPDLVADVPTQEERLLRELERMARPEQKAGQGTEQAPGPGTLPDAEGRPPLAEPPDGEETE